MAEVEISVLTRKCINERFATQEELRKNTTAWYDRPNAARTTINRQFTTNDTRISIKRLYPICCNNNFTRYWYELIINRSNFYRIN